jgi:three-Cys-motif partner protein
MSLQPEAIGLWTEIKLRIIREYAAAYTTILKEQSWCRSYEYIDAFAGGGEFVSKEDQERLIPGSPMNALNVPNKFTEYHFIDIEQSKIDRLRELTVERAEKTSIHFYVGDANQVLRKKILPKFPYSSFKRALCILDPYGVDIEWATIASLAPIKTMDVFINFPLMDINRNAALKRLETADPQQGTRLTKIWGGETWKELAYIEQAQLFDAPVLIKKIRGNEVLKQGFRDRLKHKAGFSCVPEPILMHNKEGGSLYFLFFASQKQVAQNIAQHIFEHYREIA